VVSAGNPLKSIVLDTIQVNIKVDEPNDLMIAVVHPKGVKLDRIKRQIDAAHDLFLEKYKNKMDSGHPLDEERLFKQFEKDLRERNIVHRTFLRSVLGRE
jgi:hypothetical protein